MPWLTPNHEDGLKTVLFTIPPDLVKYVVGAIAELTVTKAWEVSGDRTIEEVTQIFEGLLGDMENPFIGSVFPSLGTLPPGCLWCEGQTISGVDYPLLYAVIDAAFVNGFDITLPDLRGRFLYGSNVLGTMGGEENHTLTVNEMPAHDHGEHTHLPIQASGEIPTELPDIPVPDITASRGGGLPHNNMPPYMTVRWYIVAR